MGLNPSAAVASTSDGQVYPYNKPVFSSQSRDSLACLAERGKWLPRCSAQAYPLGHMTLGHSSKLYGPQFLIGQVVTLTSAVCITALCEGLLRCTMDTKKALEKSQVCRTVLHKGPADMLLWNQKPRRQKADRLQPLPGPQLWNQDLPLEGVQERPIRARSLPC